MTLHVLSEAEARAILDRHLDKLAEVVAAGLPDWQNLPPETTVGRSRTTRASWIHDTISAKAREVFEEDPGVAVTSKRGFITLTFEHKLILRFKKFSGRQLRTSGIMTYQRREFESQQTHLDGMPVTTVVAGYLLDKLEQEFARLAVVAPFNGQNLWEIDLEIPGQSGVGHVVPVGPKPTPTTPEVVVESSRKKTSEESEES